MKIMENRLLAALLAFCMVLALLPGTALAANKSGTCGKNATWTLDSAGTLTIKGSGKMFNYSDIWDSNSNCYKVNVPWWEARNDIKKVVIQKGITSIGDNAFFYCRNLTGVIIPSGVTKIGDFAFGQCNLTSITIPNTVTSIGNAAFWGCSFTNVTIPNSVTSIGSGAFDECGGLISITIPNSVTSIGSEAFVHCVSLTNITIPNNVTSIKEGTFRRCLSLTNVTIPVSVTSIEDSAFCYCLELSDVYYSGSENQWKQIRIDNNIEPELERGSNTSLLNATIHYNSTGPVKTCTVTFNPNGGTTTTKSKTVTNGSTYGALPTPTRTGYKFDGWYTSKTGGTKITSTTKVTKTANHTIYAHWSKRTFSVTLNPNGGTLLTDSMTVTLGTRYRSLPTPSRAGYHFDGWYTAKTGGTKVTESTQVKSGVTTLYAHWTKTAPKVQSRQTGNYQIVIPEDYKVLLYTSETTASVAKNALAQTSEYVVACTKMVKLSNGTVRYYGIFPKVSKTASYWFTYSDEMYID